MGISKFFQSQKHYKIIANILESFPLYEFKIVQFKDKTHTNSKFRYWLTFRVSDEESCFLSTFTSKDKLAFLYRYDDNATDSLVYIGTNEFNPPFDKPFTFLDCNIQDQKHRSSYKELNEVRVDWAYGFKDSGYSLPEDIKNKIIKAIVNSNFTNQEIKNGFKSHYKELFQEDKSEIVK